MKNKKVSYATIPDLIRHIKAMYYSNDHMLDNIEDINMLYNALCDLNEIVGMVEVKDSIVKQIKFLLVNNASNKNDKFGSHMLHTIIFGQPGVGKTTIGSCLANIWKSLGLVTKKNIKSDPAHLFKKYIAHKYKYKDNNSDAECDNSSDKSNEEKDVQSKFIIAYDASKTSQDTKPENNDSYIVDDIRSSINDLVVKYNNKYLKNDQYSDADVLRSYLSDLAEFRNKSRQLALLVSGITNIEKQIGTIKQPLIRKKIDSQIKIVSRPDLVGQYIGHTCDKTYNLLKNTLREGKVLFIDEAYSIVLDDRDSFGHEALNELNRFMSENPQLVVIFAGYKDKMEETLFKYQPGFKRRCTWIFEIGKYTGEMLSIIFVKQLKKDNWEYEGNMIELTKFFNDNIKHFDAFGGDTIRLAFYCKLKYSELKFEPSKSDLLKNKTITFKIVKKAYTNMYCKNKALFSENISSLHMYI